MKRGKLDSGGRLKFIHVMIIVACLYLVFMASQVSNLFSANSVEEKEKTSLLFQSLYKEAFTHKSLDVLTQNKNAPRSYTPLKGTRPHFRRTHKKSDYGRLSSVVLEQMSKRKNMTVLQRMANEAWVMGLKAWKEAQEEADFTHHNGNHSMVKDNGGILRHKCPQSVSLNQTELRKPGSTIVLPCGLVLGSSVTVIGKPHKLTKRFQPGDQYARVMQFVIELQGLKVVDGEEAPKILHFNPRIRGDWSGRPVVELNTCYRMQWGTSQRCEGLRSSDDDAEKVDGFVKCEKWIRNNSKESKAMWWLNRFIGREMKPAMDWPYPFVEDHTFVLTIRAGLEGYHINVDGRHVASFPYRTGFVLEDATGLYIDGDIQPQFAYATSLPTMYRGVSNQRTLEMSSKWKAPSLVNGIMELFIGILSASNHFAERMAARKTWMQSNYIKSSKVIVRFFVALNSRKDVNVQLKKEADFYGDIIIVHFIDNYELVVLKTVAICEYGIKNMSAKYIMKCDDDTFVRVDAVLKEIEETPHKNAIYMGNLNRFHRPLRVGKWAVSYEEWPEEQYPTYANGPGYIISENIAKFILAQHANNSLRLFKMEDVSMGMWVGQFNAASQIHYYHSWRFCQHGCTNDYITAHYQSPRQMICLWDKLLKGNADCCSE